MMCFQGPLVLCCASFTQTLYFSLFFSRFFIGLLKIVYVQIYWRSNIDICPLLVRIKLLIVWLWNLNESYKIIFLNEKHTLFYSI